MVSAHPSPLPPTLTVLHQEYREQISLRQLAKDFGVSRRSLGRAKNWLIENCHPSFQGYAPDSPLTPEQAEAIVQFRSYTTRGVKGDRLIEKMFPAPQTKDQQKTALRDLFEAHSIAPELAAKLTHSILEIFTP